MVQKSGEHQLRLVVYPIIYKVLAPSQVVSFKISEPSTVSVYYPTSPIGSMGRLYIYLHENP